MNSCKDVALEGLTEVSRDCCCFEGTRDGGSAGAELGEERGGSGSEASTRRRWMREKARGVGKVVVHGALPR